METKFVDMATRINELYKYSIATGMASNRQEFADVIGITNVTLSRFLNGKKEPSSKTLEQMNNALGAPFNIEWLVYGTGEMLGTSKPQPMGAAPGDGGESESIKLLIIEMRAQRESRDGQINELLSIIKELTSKK